MVSRTVNLQPLLAALTAAGVPVNLQVESQANPALLVGISQGGLQAQVKAVAGTSFDKAVMIRFAGPQAITTSGALSVITTDPSRVKLAAIDNVSGLETDLNSNPDGAGLESLLTHPLGSASTDFKQEASTFELQTVQHVGTTGIDPRKPDPGLADTAYGNGVVNAPAAAATLASVTPGTAGNWQLKISLGIFGGNSGTDAANLNLQKDATILTVLANPINGTQDLGPFRHTLTAVNVIKLVVVRNATVGSNYSATIAATRTG